MNWDEPNTELLRWYKRLGEIRIGCKVLAKGEFVPLYSEHKTIAYLRKDENSELLVAVNLDDTDVDVFVGEQWDNAYNFFDEVSVDGYIHLEPMRYTLLTKVKE